MKKKLWMSACLVFSLSGLPLPAQAASPIPKKPFEGQKLLPCTGKYERAINGACWIVLQAIPGSSLETMDETCAKADTYELHPGDCMKLKQIVAPIWNKEPINNT